jgi:tRNA pseudouridine55 synthase
MVSEQLEGVLLVDKPSGILSSRVVNSVKKLVKPNKVGSGGTLDKFASGLLIIMVGKATKLFETIKGVSKSYIAKVKFGEIRTTDDVYGTVVSKVENFNLTYDMVKNALNDFKGEILQVPPAFSAVHINGKRAYEVAKRDYYRALKSLSPRRVYIYEIKLLDFMGDSAIIFVECSGGTYIRSIARDLGQLLGVGGYLESLRRVKIGNIRVEQAIKFEELRKETDIKNLLLPEEKFLKMLG